MIKKEKPMISLTAEITPYKPYDGCPKTIRLILKIKEDGGREAAAQRFIRQEELIEKGFIEFLFESMRISVTQELFNHSYLDSNKEKFSAIFRNSKDDN